MIGSGPTTRFRSPVRTARLLIPLLAVDALATTAVLSWHLVDVRYDGGYLIGSAPSRLELFSPVPLLWMALVAVTSMVWIRWTLLSVDNLAALDHPIDSPRWWGGRAWFLLPHAVVTPAIVTAELWKASAVVPHRARVPVRLVLWWLTYLVGHPAVALVAGALGASGVAAVASTIWIVGAVLAMHIVERLTIRQTTLAELTEPSAAADWRRTPATRRIAPTLALFVLLAAFVGYHANTMSGSLIGAVNGWPVGDLTTGTCFTGASQAAIRTVFIVGCDEPHQGESVGAHLVQGQPGSRPDEAVLAEFAQGLCTIDAEEYTGRPWSETANLIYVSWPSEYQWRVETGRDVACLLLAPGGNVTGSERATDSGRVGLTGLTADGCYTTDPGFSTYRQTACGPDSFEVLETHLVDRTVSSPYPGELEMAQLAAESCPAGSQPLVPDTRQWSGGIRSIACLAG
jgi:hypothetical protein